MNPLTYRGYVYDRETGLYYLQSRYYNPEISRFINADAFTSTGQGLLGSNMFAYCGNNPVMCCDITGYAYYDIFSSCIDQSYISPSYTQRAYAIGARCNVSEGTISLDMDKEGTLIKELSEHMGMAVICDAIAIAACDKYLDTYGQEFLLSDYCVSYEIEEHIYAYYWATNQRLFPNTIAVLFCVKTGDWSGTRVYSATKTIDMRESDVIADGGITSQAFWFRYKDGIRDIYRGTDRDPWADVR